MTGLIGVPVTHWDLNHVLGFIWFVIVVLWVTIKTVEYVSHWWMTR